MKHMFVRISHFQHLVSRAHLDNLFSIFHETKLMCYFLEPFGSFWRNSLTHPMLMTRFRQFFLCCNRIVSIKNTYPWYHKPKCLVTFCCVLTCIWSTSHLEKTTIPHFESLHQETGHVLKPLFFQIPFGSQLFYRYKKWAFPLLNEKR